MGHNLMENKEKNFVSAVIYVYNSESKIADFLRTVIMVLESNFEKSETICVNDCSYDNSVERIKEISREFNKTCISILNMSFFHGVEVAMTAGVDLAIGDFVFEFDTMGYEFQPELLWDAYQKALEGNDIVSVETMCGNFTRRQFYRLFNKFSNTSYPIAPSVFRLVSRRAINRIASLNITCEFRQAVYASCGLKNARIQFKGKTRRKKSRNLSLAIKPLLA